MKHKATYLLLATFSSSILVWGIYFLAFYPGILSYDFAPQIIQYIQGQITTHHPTLHTLLVGTMWKLGYVGLGNANIGIALYCILQMLVLALVYLRGAYLILKSGAGMLQYICYSAFVAFFPLNGFMVCTVTKDVFFAAFLLLLVMTVLEISFARYDKIPLTTYVLLGIGIAGTCIFRNNGKYAMFGLLVALLWLYLSDKKNGKKHFKVLIITAIVFLSTLFVVKGIETVFRFEEGSKREMLSVPIQQMARIAVNNHDSMDEELLQYIESCIGTDYVEKYRPEIADPIKDTFDVHAALDNPSTFVKNYFKMLVTYPKDFFMAFVELNAGYLFFWDETCAWINGDMGYIQTKVNEVFLESIGITIDSKLPNLHAYLQNWTTKNLYLNNIILRVLLAPAWYFYLALIYFVYALFKKNKKHLPISFFFAAYFVTLFLGPGVMVRYIFPVMISEFFILFRYILKKT